MSAVKCDFLTDEGRCEGLYKGFGCIEHKCRHKVKTREKSTGEFKF